MAAWHNRKPETALDLFEKADSMGVSKDDETYGVVIFYLCRMQDQARAMHYFQEMKDRHLTPTEGTYVALIRCALYSGQGRVGALEAVRLVLEMDVRYRFPFERLLRLVRGDVHTGTSNKIVEDLRWAFAQNGINIPKEGNPLPDGRIAVRKALGRDLVVLHGRGDALGLRARTVAWHDEEAELADVTEALHLLKAGRLSIVRPIPTPRAFLADLERYGMALRAATWRAVLDMELVSKSWADAVAAHERLKTLQGVTLTQINELASALARGGERESALRVWDDMRELRHQPQAHAVRALVGAAAALGRSDVVLQLAEQLSMDAWRQPFYDAVVEAHVRLGHASKAFDVFRAGVSLYKLSSPTVALLRDALNSAKRGADAQTVGSSMSPEVSERLEAMGSLRAATAENRLQDALGVLRSMQAHSWPVDNTALVDLAHELARARDWDNASSVYRIIAASGAVQSHLVAEMMHAAYDRGRYDDVAELYRDLESHRKNLRQRNFEEVMLSLIRTGDTHRAYRAWQEYSTRYRLSVAAARVVHDAFLRVGMRGAASKIRFEYPDLPLAETTESAEDPSIALPAPPLLSPANQTATTTATITTSATTATDARGQWVRNVAGAIGGAAVAVARAVTARIPTSTRARSTPDEAFADGDNVARPGKSERLRRRQSGSPLRAARDAPGGLRGISPAGDESVVADERPWERHREEGARFHKELEPLLEAGRASAARDQLRIMRDVGVPPLPETLQLVLQHDPSGALGLDCLNALRGGKAPVTTGFAAEVFTRLVAARDAEGLRRIFALLRGTDDESMLEHAMRRRRGPSLGELSPERTLVNIEAMGVSPPAVAYSIAVQSELARRNVGAAQRIHARAQAAGCRLEDQAWCDLICAVLGSGNSVTGFALYASMREAGVRPPAAVFNFVLLRASEAGDARFVLELWHEAKTGKIPRNKQSYTLVMMSLIKGGRLDDAMTLYARHHSASRSHAGMLEARVYVALLDALVAADRADDAQTVHDGMLSRGHLTPGEAEASRLFRATQRAARAPKATPAADGAKRDAQTKASTAPPPEALSEFTAHHERADATEERWTPRVAPRDAMLLARVADKTAPAGHPRDPLSDVGARYRFAAVEGILAIY